MEVVGVDSDLGWARVARGQEDLGRLEWGRVGACMGVGTEGIVVAMVWVCGEVDQMFGPVAGCKDNGMT